MGALQLRRATTDGIGRLQTSGHYLPIVWLEMYIASMDRQFYLPET
jgi:hypothetical protein